MKQFVPPNDPILTAVAKPVPQEYIESSQIKNDIDTMLTVALGEQKDPTKPLLVGLAAPQIGISKRIIIVDRKANGKGDVGDIHVYINPEITWHSTNEEEWYEGCYSTDRVCGIVSRPVHIRLEAFDQKGRRVKEEFSHYTARIFQHEIDHLNGKEFISHITDDTKLHWVKESEFQEYRNNEKWRNWPNKCPRSKWMKIKGIV